MRIHLDRMVSAAIVAAWLGIVGISLWPASWWYTLQSVLVTDEYTSTGARIIEVDRTIRRPFFGRWTVEEQLRRPDGFYTTVQECRGYARYRTDKAPPDPATLSWWKGSRCAYVGGFDALPSGTYRLCTFVTVRPAFFPEKKVERCSPDFTR